MNPAHEAALRGAVDLAQHPAIAAVPTYCADMASVSNPPLKWAFEALSSPTSAAELIRQVVERAGHHVIADYDKANSYPCVYIAHNTHESESPAIIIELLSADDAEFPDWAEWVTKAEIVPLIARLLALAPNAGAEAVLKALRDAS